MAYDYPKYGNPRSEVERRRRHKRLHPNSKLPPRGSGKGAGRRRNGDEGRFVAEAIKERKSV